MFVLEKQIRAAEQIHMSYFRHGILDVSMYLDRNCTILLPNCSVICQQFLRGSSWQVDYASLSSLCTLFVYGGF